MSFFDPRKGCEGKKTGGKNGKKRGNKEKKIRMKIVATTSLPAVDHPNADRWNAARSLQKIHLDELIKSRIRTN